MERIEVREARLEDAGEIAEILVRSWQAAYGGLVDLSYLQAMDKRHYTQVYAESLFKRRDKIYVAEVDAAVQGFILGNFLTEGPYDCEVKELYVHPRQQGKGIGRNLMAAMMGFFREAGMACLLIWALQGAANNDFYRKLGGGERERTETEVGGKKYPLIGFVFALQPQG